MRRWMYDVGIRTFPWHLSWKTQPEKLKVEFWRQLREEFPHHWSEWNVDEYMNTTLRSSKYRARKIIRAKGGRQRLLYEERRFARDELERQEKDPVRKMAFEKARKAAHARKRYQKFGRGGLVAFQRKFVRMIGVN